MKVPGNYNLKLENIIDQHTKHSLIPNKYVVSYFDIALDMNDFLQDNIEKKVKILEIGGRTFPSKINNIYDITMIEDRPRYASYLAEYFNEKVKDISKLLSLINKFDIIIIHADYIAELGYKNLDLSKINALVSAEQKLYIIEYKWEKLNDKLTTVSEDGALYNTYRYNQWFNIVRNHMHLGYTEHEYPSIKIIDLSYFY